MTPARKTGGILGAAGVVAAVASMLSAATVPPRAASRGAGGVRASARLQSSHVLAGAHETHMAVTVQAPDDPGARRRPPVNLAIVIDRSGSMQGQKIEDAKGAARQLVDQLEPGDRVAIVTYDWEAEVVLASSPADSRGKQAAHRAIDAITSDGGTNISGGLTAGREEVLAYRSPRAVSRIVLISDGLATDGLTEPDELARLASATAESGVSITTVGVGLDFDERTMARIAVSGAGNYYFAESSAMLAELFEQELGKLGATVATELRVRLAPARGVRVVEAYGYELEVDSDGAVWIAMSDLHAGETRKVVLRLHVDAGGARELEVARVDVSYRPVGAREPEHIAMTARARVTTDERDVRDGRDREAAAHIERARTARAIDEATVLYERGDYAAAQQVLEARKAADLGDAELEEELDAAAEGAAINFAKAPAASGEGGRKASKKNRAKGYDLMY